MKIQIISPSRLLSQYIKYYWILESEKSIMNQLVFPTGDPQMLFHYRYPFRNTSINGESDNQPFNLFCGQKTKPQFSSAEKPAGVIGIEFYPHTAKVFFPCPMDELTGLALDISDVFKGCKDLKNRIIECPNNYRRIQIIESFLIKRIKIPNNYHFQLINKSIGDIRTVYGRISSSSLVSESGLSERQFERIFLNHVGISPKRLIEIIRFNYSVSLFETSMNLSQIAHESGFYDQSHFIRTFKNYSNMLPGEFRQEYKKEENSDCRFYTIP